MSAETPARPPIDSKAAAEEAAEAYADAKSKGDLAKAADVAEDLAQYHLGKEEMTKAGKYLSKRLEALEGLHGTKTHASYAATLVDLAFVNGENNEADKALKNLRECLEIEDALAVTQHLSFIPLGKQLMGRQEFANALPVWERARAEMEATAVPGNTDLMEVLFNVAMCKVQLDKNNTESQQLAERALEIAKEAKGDNAPETIQAHIGVAGVYQFQNDVDGCVRHLREALAAATAADNKQMALQLCQMLFSVFMKTGRKEEGLDTLEQQRALVEKFFGPDHPAVKQAQQMLEAAKAGKNIMPASCGHDHGAGGGHSHSHGGGHNHSHGGGHDHSHGGGAHDHSHGGGECGDDEGHGHSHGKAKKSHGHSHGGKACDGNHGAAQGGEEGGCMVM